MISAPSTLSLQPRCPASPTSQHRLRTLFSTLSSILPSLSHPAMYITCSAFPLSSTSLTCSYRLHPYRHCLFWHFFASHLSQSFSSLAPLSFPVSLLSCSLSSHLLYASIHTFSPAHGPLILLIHCLGIPHNPSLPFYHFLPLPSRTLLL